MSDVFVGNNDHGDVVPPTDVLLQMIEALRTERDEARREVCRNEANHLPTMADPRREAKRRGWDCFKEDGK
jgi:hypothetical protein